MSPVILWSVVVGEGIALFILKENTGDVSDRKWIVVAVSSQLAMIEAREVFLLTDNVLENAEGRIARVARLAIELGIVVADHVNVQQILDTVQRQGGVVGKPIRAPEVGVLSRKCYKIDVCGNPGGKGGTY